MKKSLIIIFLLLAAENIQPAELQHTFDLRSGVDINKTLGNRWVNEGKYELVVGGHWQVGVGFLAAPGWSFYSAYHLEMGYEQLFVKSLSFHVKFLNQSYHSVLTADNSIIPYFSWRRKNFEADLGLNMRFTNFGPQYYDLIFYYPTDLVQPHFYWRVAWYLAWEKPSLRLGLEIKNTEWNYAGNSYQFGVHLDTVYQINEAWSINFNAGTIPSGLSGLHVVHDHFIFLLGVQYQI
ncbi:MAG: hypothetical protein ABUK01_10655 [Leptospirales bacterium]